MSFRLVKIKEDSFFKEVFWVIFILLLTFLPHLHLFFDDTLIGFEVFGVSIDHKFMSNQTFMWFFLNSAQILIFLFLFIRICQLQLGYILLFPIYWSICDLIWILMSYEVWKEFQILFELYSIFITLLFGSYLIKIKSKQIFKTGFKKLSRILLSILFIGIPLLINIVYEMPSQPEIEIFGVFLSSSIIPDATTYLLVLLLKFYLFVVLLGLFFTVNGWWKYSILLPILITTFQFKTVLTSKSEYIDTYEVFEALPLLLLVLTFLLFLSRSAYYNAKLKSLYKKTLSHIEKKRVIAIKDQLGIMRKQWKETLMFTSKTENIEELRTFKKELERQLKEL